MQLQYVEQLTATAVPRGQACDMRKTSRLVRVRLLSVLQCGGLSQVYEHSPDAEPRVQQNEQCRARQHAACVSANILFFFTVMATGTGDPSTAGRLGARQQSAGNSR